jgi:transcriptional regulator with XRE-family HTH domain
MAGQSMIFVRRVNVKPIEQLRKYIKATHPQAAVTLTPPLNKEGVWSIDLACGDKRLAIEWSLATGFGVSSVSDESYGERPDETFQSLEGVQRRITELLTRDERTAPPLGVLLSRLREIRGYTQEQLASKLGVRQATVSGMERRDDIQFSTLRRTIKALNGSLEIFVVFLDARYRLDPGSIDFAVDAQPRIARCELGNVSAHTGTDSPELDYEATFEALHESGGLAWARKVASDISSRGTVLEMAD